MDIAIADSINRRDARLIAEHLDALDSRLQGDRKPWHLGPMGAAFADDHHDDGTNSYRAWLIGKHSWRVPGLSFDGCPAGADWDGFVQHLRAEIDTRRTNTRDPQTHLAHAAEIPAPGGVVSR